MTQPGTVVAIISYLQSELNGTVAFIALILQGLGFIFWLVYALWMRDIKSDVTSLREEVSNLRVKVAAFTRDSNGKAKTW